MNDDLLYQTILNRLTQEDEELTSLTNQGIFCAPELYIAFIIGKEIKTNETTIFGKEALWIRETDFGNGGPTDFAFKTDSDTFVFEVKLRNTIDAYAADVVKLKRLDQNYTKYFLALVDSWDTDREKDGRIVALENQHKDLKRISLTSFPTKQNWYKGKISCTLGLWKL